jgi:hypothetical protein
VNTDSLTANSIISVWKAASYSETIRGERGEGHLEA